MFKLANASVAQQNAAFDAVFPELKTLVQQYVPSFFQDQVMAKLQSTEGRTMLVKLIDDGLTAALNVNVGEQT